MQFTYLMAFSRAIRGTRTRTSSTTPLPLVSFSPHSSIVFTGTQVNVSIGSPILYGSSTPARKVWWACVQRPRRVSHIPEAARGLAVWPQILIVVDVEWISRLLRRGFCIGT
ncbi:hypothetical protein M758_UG256500 [Ceratodon purpureus]|nr:hypothetical protein M758_UG256500 [Ceratodon purpureus]